MHRVPTETGAAPDTASLHFREQIAEDGAPHDATTVAFDGAMKVAADERGGDPYNRTGSFKRLVR
jgi:hypothetical protein